MSTKISVDAQVNFILTAVKAGALKLGSLCIADAPVMLNMIRARLVTSRELLFKELSGTSKDFRKMKKKIITGFDTMDNRIKSILDMIENDDISPEDLTKYSAWQYKVTDKLSSLILELNKLSSGEPMKKLHVTASQDSDIEQSDYNSADEALDAVMDKAESVLKHFSIYKDKMPASGKKIKKPFVVNRYPIIPVMRSLITPKDFEQFGVSVTHIEGQYMVLENQLCVGFNTSSDIKVSVDDFLAALAERTGKDWTTMGSPRKDSKGFLWYWIFPESILNALASEGKHLKVREWAFPYKR